MNLRCGDELEQWMYYVNMYILVDPILKVAFLKVGMYSYYTVIFHFRLYNMSCTALDMYQLILKHHETLPQSEKRSDSK